MVGVAEGMRVGGWLLKGGGTSLMVGVPTFSLNLGVSSLYTFSHENILDYSTVL